MVLIPLHVMLPSACFAYPKAMVGVMLASPVWLGGKGHLGVGWSEGVDAERPRGLLENEREQSVCSAQKVLCRIAAELSGR